MIGYREGLFQVFSNIILNAVKYSSGRNINVILDVKNNEIQFSVRDHGAGIKKEELSRIFEPYSRGWTKNTTIKGSGLGLSISKKWVEFHGGKIWAESDGLGKGTKISCIIPMI